MRILDYFSEPYQYRDGIRKERCCSNCNPEYSLDNLDDSRYYLYSEKGCSLRAPQKAIAKDILAWASEQCLAVYKNRIFTPDATFFLSTSQQTLLAKEAQGIFSLDDLQKILGPWRHFSTHGKGLLSVIKASRSGHLRKSKQRPTDEGSQSQQVILDDQMSEILSAPTFSASQPVPQQSVLPVLLSGSELQTPSLTIPNLSISTQTAPSDIPPGPVTSATPLASGMTHKRRPLGSISGNTDPKRQKGRKNCSLPQ